MQMSTSKKFNLLFAIIILGSIIYSKLQPQEKIDEIIIDKIHIPRQPCISVVNELLGRGIDSSKFCECIIPQFYNLIKKDSLLVERFKNSGGFFKLEGSMNDSVIALFGECAKTNIVDSNYKFQMLNQYEFAFKEKFKKEFKLHKEFDNIDTDNLSDCIVDKLKGNITVGEYFADDYFEIPKIKRIIVDCLAQSTNHK
jgi:hypothetical protein